MTEADKIVAAIFAANMCAGKNADHATYLQTYDEFIDLMEKRWKAKHKMSPISDAAIEFAGRP
jgi:pantothenate synthetase